MARGRPSRAAVFGRLDQAVAELRNVGGLPSPDEAEEIWEGLWYEETHNSTALEGNTLVLKEVKTLLEEGRAVGDKELREYLEVQGYAEAAQWIYREGYAHPIWTGEPLIRLSEVREIHARTVGPAWRHFPPDQGENEGPGAFRRHDIEPFVGGMRPPPWPDVPAQMTDWVAATEQLRAYVEAAVAGTIEPTVHPLSALAGLHAWFERIHPFRDGNGRSGRLALNLMLVRLAYPPAVVYKRDRAKYLKALDRADRDDSSALAELLARSLTHGIDRFLLPALAGPHRIIPLTALADGEVSLIALRRAAERGRLRAQRRSDQWYSTRKWVDDYKTSRHRGKPRQVHLGTRVSQPGRGSHPPTLF